MTVHATLVSGPIGPDTIDLPGEPSKLRNAAQDLRDLSSQLEQSAQQLQEAKPEEGNRGRTATALLRGARRTAETLESDAKQLGELADAVEGEADALSDGQGTIDGLRQQWRQARDVFRDAMQDAKSGPQDPGALMHRIDSHAADPHQSQFQNQAGLSFLDGGGGGAQEEAMLVDEGGKVEQAIAEYRRAVRGVLDDFSDVMQKVKNADNDLDARLPRRTSVAFAEANGGGDGDDADHDNVSSPISVQSIASLVQDASQTLNRSTELLESIRLAIRAGRMLPEDERMGSNDGFKRDWTEHFETLREGLNACRRAADAAIERLRQADHDGAADIRQALRDR